MAITQRTSTNVSPLRLFCKILGIIAVGPRRAWIVTQKVLKGCFDNSTEAAGRNPGSSTPSNTATARGSCPPARISITFQHVAKFNLVGAAFVGHSPWIGRGTVYYPGNHLPAPQRLARGWHLFAPFIPTGAESSIACALCPRWPKRLQFSRDQYLLWLGQLGLG